MPRIDPVNFYLEEREEGSNTYHYQYINWRRIISLFHPRKSENEAQLQRYYSVCEKALIHALSQPSNRADFAEIKEMLSIIRTYKPT